MRSYWRGYNHDRRYQKKKYYFEDREIDFTLEDLDYNHFLLQEFFDANDQSWWSICNHYEQQYGKLSLSYIKRKRSEWANGNFHLTDLIKTRILELMPECLDEEARHNLALHEFMSTIKKTIHKYSIHNISTRLASSSMRPDEFSRLFSLQIAGITKAQLEGLKFNVLSDEEKTEALAISKYILENKLQTVYYQIERDFRVFIPFMSRLKKGLFSAVYLTEAFAFDVDIATSGTNTISFPRLDLDTLSANSRFKLYAEKFLAFERLNSLSSQKTASVNAFLNQNDLELFFSHYEAMQNSSSEVRLKSSFLGEGGTLSLAISIKTISLLYVGILASVAKIVLYILLTILAIGLIVAYEFWFGILILLAIGTYFFQLTSDEVRTLQQITIELRRHGRK